MDKSINNKNKFSLRYTNAGILLMLILISILSVLISLFFQNSEYLEKYNLDHFYYNDFPSVIYDSLYDENSQHELMDNSVKYIIRGLKTDNFENTEKFKKYYPDEVIVRDKYNKIIYRGSRSEFEESKDEFGAGKGYKVSINNNLTEDPKYKVTFLTNLNDLDLNTNPQEYKVPDSNNIYAVKGYYENGKLKITYQKKADDKYNDFVNNFNRSLKTVYGDIRSNYYGIEKLNFMYLLDFSSKEFQNEMNRAMWNNVILPSSAIAMVIVSVFTIFFAMISNFDKLKEVSFVQSLKRFPFEIVILLCCLWFLPIIFIVEQGADILNPNGVIIYIIMAIMVLLMLIAVYYFVIGLKSIYWDGTKSFVWKNSIIVRLFKCIVKNCKKLAINIASYFQKDVDITTEGLKKLKIIYAVFVVIGFIGSLLVFRPLNLIIFVLWMILITVIYFISKKYVIDLNNINEASKKIVNGDYSVNISEDETYFKGIAHSFNTISDNLSRAVSDAVKSERMKTELITNVSHDLKTPLTSIINYSDLIINENTTEDEKDAYAKVIYEKSIKLKHLIEDLFEVSKASSGNIELDLEDIDFRAIIMQIAGEWEDKFEEKNLTLVENLPENQAILNIDGNKTSRILDNLFSNIYKYAMPHTRVYVDLIRKENKTILTIKNISNYSLNISPEELVDRFTRGDESRNTEGSGLGLSIATSLVEAQGGKFSIEIDGDLFKTEIEF